MKRQTWEDVPDYAELWLQYCTRVGYMEFVPWLRRNHPDVETNAYMQELHLRKIDLADECLILNVDGYIGESTGRELAYAREHSKVIRFLEDPEAVKDTPPPTLVEVAEVEEKESALEAASA